MQWRPHGRPEIAIFSPQYLSAFWVTCAAANRQDFVALARWNMGPLGKTVAAVVAGATHGAGRGHRVYAGRGGHHRPLSRAEHPGEDVNQGAPRNDRRDRRDGHRALRHRLPSPGRSHGRGASARASDPKNLPSSLSCGEGVPEVEL
jgi:hypothetical protein